METSRGTPTLNHVGVSGTVSIFNARIIEKTVNKMKNRKELKTIRDPQVQTTRSLENEYENTKSPPFRPRGFFCYTNFTIEDQAHSPPNLKIYIKNTK